MSFAVVSLLTIAEGVKKTFRCKLIPQLLLPFHLPQLYPSDLSRNRLGQRINELDLTGILVWRGDPLDIFLEFGCQSGRGCVARGENYKRFDNFAAHLVGAGNDCRLSDGGMLFQGALYFKWSNTIARADNHVIGATHKPEV